LNLRTWGSQPRTFCLCNAALTTQLTMLPELTNYVTNGPEWAKCLAQGPHLASYRGLQIIVSRKFSMDARTSLRDLLHHQVRVAEYYCIPWNPINPTRTYEFYDQSRDMMFSLLWQELLQKSQFASLTDGNPHSDSPDDFGAGPWSYELFKQQQTPVTSLGIFDPSTMRLCNSLTLKGRLGNDSAPGQCLVMTGFAYSQNMDNYSRKRQMALNEVLEAIPNVRLLNHNNQMIVGLSHSAVKLIYTEFPQKKEMALLAQQAKLFCRGLYNDPITTMAQQEERILTNYNSLKQIGVACDFEKQWTVVHAFETLDNMFSHSVYGSKALETCIQTCSGCDLAITPLADWACLDSSSGSGLQPLHCLTKNMLYLLQETALLEIRQISAGINRIDDIENEGEAFDPTLVEPDFLALQQSQPLVARW